MTRRLRPQAWPLLLSLLLGCGTWVGNAVDQSGETNKGGGGTASLRVEISTDSPQGEVRHTGKDGTAAGTLQLSDITMTVERVRFSKEGKEVAQTDWKTPRVIQLNSAAAELASDLKIAADSFDEVSFDTAGTAGSVAMKGTFLNGGASVHVDLSFTRKVSVSFSVTAGQARAGSDKQSTLSLTLKLNRWFDFSGRSFDLRDLASPITMSTRADLEEVLSANVGRSGDEEKTDRSDESEDKRDGADEDDT